MVLYQVNRIWFTALNRIESGTQKRIWSIIQNAQPASSTEKLKHMVANSIRMNYFRFTNVNVGKGGAIYNVR